MTSPADSPNDSLPAAGRLLGVDYGAVRIGLAVCDAERRIASPLATVQRENQQRDGNAFLQIVRSENIVGIVVGLPIHLSGDESPKSLAARRFANWLRTLTGLPVTLFDERFSTVIADELIGSQLTSKQRRERIDKIAAQVILSSYIESTRDPSSPNSD